jgi:hypothetical protein
MHVAADEFLQGDFALEIEIIADTGEAVVTLLGNTQRETSDFVSAD